MTTKLGQQVTVCKLTAINVVVKNSRSRFLVFLPRDANAERGDATVSRPSVRPSVTIGYLVQIGLNSSKIISRPNSLTFIDPTFQKWNTISEPPGGSETA